VILGVGVGWLEEEFDAIGVPFADRGARTDDHVHALRALWEQDTTTYHGQFVDFENAKMYPKPVNGTVPVVVGGHSKPAARRAGRLGDGFFPARTTPEELTGLLEEMRRAAKDAGRDPDAIEVTAGGVMDLDGVKRFGDLGVDRIVLPPLGFDAETLKQQLGLFAENVIGKVN
jgi:alkanesulfonate monooxygenase SsuD/methylene tetrahydromethanopterin reductase-like flavin-dependent oxidoreductase (luciferase family)